jgi:hypothetical protein
MTFNFFHFPSMFPRHRPHLTSQRMTGTLPIQQLRLYEAQADASHHSSVLHSRHIEIAGVGV